MVTSSGEYGTGGFRKRAMCILKTSKVSNSKEKNKLIIEWVSYDVFSREKLWGKPNSIVPWHYHDEGPKRNEPWLIKEVHAVYQKSPRIIGYKHVCKHMSSFSCIVAACKKSESVYINQYIKSSSLPRAVEMEALTKRRTSHPLDPPITSGSHLIGRRQRL